MKQLLIAILFFSSLASCAKVADTEKSPTTSESATPFAVNSQVVQEVLQGGPRSRRVGVDMVDSRPDGRSFQPSIALRRDQTLYLAGWAYDELINAPCNAVAVTAGRKKVLFARYGLQRADVALYFNNDRVKDSGYTIGIPAASLGVGTHDVEVYCVAEKIREGNRGVSVSVH